MRIRRSVTSLVIMTSLAGAFLAAATAWAPLSHHATSQHATVQTVHNVAIDSVTTPGANPDVFYDI
jgi:hypothetical protein